MWLVERRLWAETHKEEVSGFKAMLNMQSSELLQMAVSHNQSTDRYDATSQKIADVR
jgi:succinate dehydrogenase flavin-adding protein (antitoxin of CptAB toxin-antitoxin module)